MDQHQVEILHEIAEKMHPHSGKDNHTSRLINKLVNNEKLDVSEIFDLGKYYNRMIQYVDQSDKADKVKEFNKLHAILQLKSDVYSIR